MAALFPRRATAWARGTLLGALVLVVAAPLAAMWWVRQPPVTLQGHTVAQPIPFDHRLHVTGMRIDCLYCHFAATKSAYAGLPPTTTCIPCHSQVYLDSRLFREVRASIDSQRPIPWQRVNALPDYVFFNHAIHVHKGVGCESCHGRVDRMAEVRQAAPLTMSWCVNCHAAPERQLRPVEGVTTMGWVPPRPQAELGPELMREYHVRRLTHCSTCHR